jgi:hypothetical protein
MWAHSRIPIEVMVSSLGDEFAPGVAGGVDDVVVGFEDEV